MALRQALAGVLAMAVVGGAAVAARADVVLPAKWYVKIDEPVTVKFYASKMQPVRRGEDATELGDAKPATATAVVGSDGMPTFSLYSMDGKKLDASKATGGGVDPSNVDVSIFYPQVREGGAYVLVWNDAQPLVIETLYNPGRGKQELEQIGSQLSAAQKKQFEPTVTHIVPLQKAVLTTDKGTITATFAYDDAPHTIDNFVSLSRQNFYDGTVFHRIIKGFMIQGGDSLGTVAGRAGTGGPGYEVGAEFSDKTHDRGVLSMARSQDRNSAGSQFFIMLQKHSELDHQYTAFGQVIDGMKVVDAIGETPVSDNNGTVSGAKPVLQNVRIEAATPADYGIKK